MGSKKKSAAPDVHNPEGLPVWRFTYADGKEHYQVGRDEKAARAGAWQHQLREPTAVEQVTEGEDAGAEGEPES